jgi:crotonobetainyl-CoA:carnitine CoA-transferase CaiB-like acyl-CoA transferase
MTLPSTTATRHRPLTGVRILSLSLNLPGPAALQRLRHMGATCVKLEQPAPLASSANGVQSGITGDPMSLYSPTAYLALHEGIQVLAVNFKTDVGQALSRHSVARRWKHWPVSTIFRCRRYSNNSYLPFVYKVYRHISYIEIGDDQVLGDF